MAQRPRERYALNPMVTGALDEIMGVMVRSQGGDVPLRACTIPTSQGAPFD